MSNGTTTTTAAPSRTVTAVSIFEDQIAAVASDGTLWVFNASQGKWHEMPALPQPPAPPPAAVSSGTAAPAATTTTAAA